MKKNKIFAFLLTFTLIFTIFTTAASAKIERYDLTSDQITYHENARITATHIIKSIYGNTFSSYSADSSVNVYDQFLRQVTYFLRRDFVNDPVEKCLYELTLNDISDHGNGKIIHFTAEMDVYTSKSTEPTVKTMDIFIKYAFVYKVLIPTDVYISEKSLENLLFADISPMTSEKFGDWADATNEAEYAALAEKMAPETADIINHYEREIFKDIYHNQNENVTVKISNNDAFETAKQFLNDYITCISEKKALETSVPMASEYVHRYLTAMTKYYGILLNHDYSDAKVEFNYIDSYAYENNVYLKIQFLTHKGPGTSSEPVLFRFIQQDDGSFAIANYCETVYSFDTEVFDFNNYARSSWFDLFIRDTQTIDYAEVIKRAERIAENGYFPSNTTTDVNITVPVETPPTDPDISYSEPAENEFISNPTTADISMIFYILAVISAVLSCITFKKRT